MTSPFRGQALRPRAIELLKAGRSADALHVEFVNEGADPEEVRAVLTELVALQQQAAAMDPARLRSEARWMFLQGASTEDVVAHFVRVGVPEPNARPEVARILAQVQKLKPCQRCGSPSEPTDLTFDLSGFLICKACDLRDGIGRSEARGLASEVAAIGGGLGGGLVVAIAAAALEHDANNYGQTARPFCGACRVPSGIRVYGLDRAIRARLDPTAEWVCGQCWRKIA